MIDSSLTIPALPTIDTVKVRLREFGTQPEIMSSANLPIKSFRTYRFDRGLSRHRMLRTALDEIAHWFEGRCESLLLSLHSS
jgi:hypothetical protein